MAKRKSPAPAITQRWVGKLRMASQEVEVLRAEAERAERRLGKVVRAAFAEGVLVGPMKQATGLSGSRIYQLKWALRDAGIETAEADALHERFREHTEPPAVLAGPVAEECQHPRTYGPGPREGQCTICHEQAESINGSVMTDPDIRLYYKP